MMTQMRYIFLVLAIIISLHFILSFSHEGYGRATSISHIKDQLTGPKSQPPYKTPVEDEFYIHANKTLPPERKANATFVMLVRNSDLNGIMNSMKQIEDRFNRKFRYPYVFLNDNPFDEKFKRLIQGLTESRVEFGQIPKNDWNQPSWIDETKASAARETMAKNGVIYGDTETCAGSILGSSGDIHSYNNTDTIGGKSNYSEMRSHLLTPKLRVEPDVKFYCDLDYDPFLYMEEKKKVYGFTISLYEYEATIPTLWNTVKNFLNEYPETLAKDNAMSFLSDDGGVTYNRCHFWSNFEIGDLDFWRSEAYSKFFDYLDKEGGFYYERWGDAPVHSIGAALFASKDQIHFFNDIGYRHEPFQHCPQQDAHTKGRCWCDPEQNFDYEGYSCLKRYDALFD